jgi:6-phosphofructo-2-kinase/fructose-2,6-biphosphatase 4
LSPDGLTTATRISSPALNVKVVEKTQMSEINPGIWDGLSPDQAKKYYPADWERFAKDPYAFRAPRAESYHDLSGSSPLALLVLDSDASVQCAWSRC